MARPRRSYAAKLRSQQAAEGAEVPYRLVRAQGLHGWLAAGLVGVVTLMFVWVLGYNLLVGDHGATQCDRAYERARNAIDSAAVDAQPVLDALKRIPARTCRDVRISERAAEPGAAADAPRR